MPAMGTGFCLGSGAPVRAMAVFGKLAYGEGATVGTLLAVRFTLAAALFWAAGAAVRAGRARAPPARPLAPPGRAPPADAAAPLVGGAAAPPLAGPAARLSRRDL